MSLLLRPFCISLYNLCDFLFPFFWGHWELNSELLITSVSNSSDNYSGCYIYCFSNHHIQVLIPSLVLVFPFVFLSNFFFVYWHTGLCFLVLCFWMNCGVHHSYFLYWWWWSMISWYGFTIYSLLVLLFSFLLKYSIHCFKCIFLIVSDTTLYLSHRF